MRSTPNFFESRDAKGRSIAGSGGASKPDPLDPALRQFAAVLETAVDAIVVINEQGLIQAFNRAAEQMFGYGRHEVVAKNIHILMPEPYSAEHDQYIQSYLATGRARIIGIGREAVGRRKDGTIFPIDLAVSEVIDGKRRTFTGIVRDLTERRQLEAEILDVSEREQQRIGHELHDGLCQELAGIGFAVRALQQKAGAGECIDPAELNSVTALLQDAVRHARGLSRGLYPVDAEPNGLEVALTQLAADASDLFKIRCIFESPGSAELPQSDVATHLYRIAQEAIREAVRHGKANRVVITLVSNRRKLTLSVSDNGVALSADERYRHGMVLRMVQHRARVIGAQLHVRDGLGGLGVRVVCQIQVAIDRRLK